MRFLIGYNETCRECRAADEDTMRVTKCGTVLIARIVIANW